MTFLIYIVSFILLISILVTVHEYGHFLFARLFKVHVQRFSVGMGPVIYKKTDKFGTEFAISALPLGGYVSMINNKLLQEDPSIKKELTEEQLNNTFDVKPKWQRALIMFGGPLANFLLSIFVFSFIFFTTVDPKMSAFIKEVNFKQDVSFSQQLNPGDRIISLNNVNINDQKDLSLELLSFAGHSGEIKFKIKDKQNLEKNIIATVNNFISSSEAQKNPVSGLGIEVIFNSIPVIGGFTKDGPGIDSGLQKGDLILRINEKEISSTNDVSSIISQKPNELVNVEIRRGSESINYNILTTSINKNDGSEIGILGISFGSKRSVFGSITKAINETFNLSIKTIQFIGKMLTGSMGAENLSGPIGIAQMAGNTAQMGFMPFLYLMALLSISLGVLNLLPIPVLDGGQLTLLGIEALRGKPLPENIENMIYSTGGIIVILLMVFVIFNDISRFL